LRVTEVRRPRSTVLITGGSEGLGRAIAREFVQAGDKVYACARTATRLADAAESIPGLQTVVADITDPSDRERLWTTVESAGDCVDILINNAAITRAHDYTNDVTLARDHAQHEIAVNLAAPIELCRQFLEARRRLGQDEVAGAVVNIGTPAAIIPLEAQPLYCATKAGLHMFTLILRRQLAGSSVAVIEVFPPGLPTELARELDVAGHHADPSVVDTVAHQIFRDIVAGVDVSLPHDQSRALYEAVPQVDPAFVDQVNSRVTRRPGWDSGT
jgi:uncharacterized oxidoreductase